MTTTPNTVNSAVHKLMQIIEQNCVIRTGQQPALERAIADLIIAATPSTPSAAGLPPLPKAALRKIRWPKLGGGWIWQDWAIGAPPPSPQFETTDYLTVAQAQAYALAAIAAQQQAAVPEGWQLVPVEADEAMLCAGGRELTAGPPGDKYTAQALGIYNAMLAAAPLPPTAPQKTPDHLDSGVFGGVQAWQSIKSAPRDGSHIQLYAPDLQFVGFYADLSGWCCVAPRCPLAPSQPTHWKPLGSAPTGEGV